VSGPGLVSASAALAPLLSGLIRTVQLVHYPRFALVGQGERPHFHLAHGCRVMLLVGWLMPLELVASLALAVPLHHRLEQRHDPVAIAQLVGWNWIRTAPWTSRALLLSRAVGERL
jgi:hypothetical protein